MVADASFLLDFMKQGINEDHYIDYKRDIKKDLSKEEKIEFLKDVSAFANASGGNVIFGVDEPNEKKLPTDLLIGIDDGDTIAREMERTLGSCIEPRIPGLQVVSVPIKNGKVVIIVHIPPSTSKPHLVTFKKHRCYYIRRSEEITMMGSHEIREQVLFAATSEARVERYLREREDEFTNYVDMESPKFFFQAVPTISIDPEWDVLNKETRAIIEDSSKRIKTSNYWLSQLRSRPNMAGVEGRRLISGRVGEYFRVSRNGYISAASYNDHSHKHITGRNVELIEEFFNICNTLIGLHDSDVPYLARVRYYDALGTKFAHGSPGHVHLSEPFEMEVINFDDQIRLAGQDFMEISERIKVQLFNAFGLEESDVLEF